MLVASLIGFAVAWWLGCYLAVRDPRKPLLRRTAIGLLAYAPAIPFAAEPVVGGLLAGLPALMWTGVLLRLPAGRPVSRWDRWWSRGWLPTGLAASAVAALLDDPVVSAAVSIGIGAGLAAGFGVAWRWRRRAGSGRALGPTLVMTILLGLGSVAMILPTGLLPAPLALAAVGVDLVILGVLIAWSDALDEGQALRADLLRSAVSAGLVAVVFGGQVWLATLVTDGREGSLTVLLYGCVAAGIALQVFAGPVNRLVDRFTLPEPVEREREELREAWESLPRRDSGGGAEWPPEEFHRLVRRALRDYSDLGRLVASPLTGLPVIGERLAARGAVDSPLERATELKTLLREGVERLKPPGDFGLSDEWRYYHSLYYVYVVGLRPYSQRARHDGISAEAARVLQWFRVAVPQRSLHNWQNAAARLVADAIRDETVAK
ncbi:hypothetical protein LX16_0028 [Stackebrandtia albiflava]|uniref:Uncharacterized protein n=1 Tax=Stackebrandtia albiflava TaxID=406432 RepID=A0A562VGS6_9ACTN|nr:hypothetical protein [Stackebrandtia albiflava]TWJ17113.1 hypothetical protein LX16_0028 [Stackebrandtia albiflava]